MNNCIVLNKSNVERIGSDLSQLIMISINLLTDDSAHNIAQLVSYIATSKRAHILPVTKIIKVKLCNAPKTVDGDFFVYLDITVMMHNRDGREILGSIEFSISAEGNLTTFAW